MASEKAILIIGAGGLGCPAALALVRSGFRRLILCDGDVVEPSNLHRQILLLPGDLGRNKAETAARRLREIDPAAIIDVHRERLTAETARSLLSKCDFVIDATDSAPSKFLVNDACVLFGKPFAHAGVVGFEGQLLTVLPGESACLRCIFPEPPAPGEVASCTEAGILGPLAGIAGALQAEEALRLLRGETPRFVDRLFTIDLVTPRFRPVAVRRSPDCPVCGPSATIRSLEPARAPCDRPIGANS